MNRNRFLPRLAVLWALALPAALPAEEIPAYVPQAVTPPAGAGYLTRDGSIRIVAGNRGMGHILKGFNELFVRTHPGTTFTLEFNRLGNSVNLLALTHGITFVAPMGREAMPVEIVPYRKIVGADPLVIRIAHGTIVSRDKAAPLAIYVNRTNPLARLTTDEVARIFTTGAPGGDLTTWGQLGLTGAWGQRAIHPCGTPEASGFGSFMVLRQFAGRTLAPTYESFLLAAEIVQRVGEDPGAIGFSALGFQTPATKVLAVARQPQGPFMTGIEAEIASGGYPYDRFVHLYLRREPGRPLDPFVKEYIRLVLSREGQQIIAGEPGGFIPLNAREAATELAKLD
jgi:phosphate transport system substrate-binding protein